MQIYLTDIENEFLRIIINVVIIYAIKDHMILEYNRLYDVLIDRYEFKNHDIETQLHTFKGPNSQVGKKIKISVLI